MRRLPGWRGRMERMTDELRTATFDWATFECGVAWGARHVDQMLGTDFASIYRGRFTDAVGALRVMREAGFSNLGDLVSSHLPEIHPSQARLGDLAAIETEPPFGYSLGLVNGERILVLRETGLGTVDLLTAARAWRVGDA